MSKMEYACVVCVCILLWVHVSSEGGSVFGLWVVSLPPGMVLSKCQCPDLQLSEAVFVVGLGLNK
jgi:hypothetical protein